MFGGDPKTTGNLFGSGAPATGSVFGQGFGTSPVDAKIEKPKDTGFGLGSGLFGNSTPKPAEK